MKMINEKAQNSNIKFINIRNLVLVLAFVGLMFSNNTNAQTKSNEKSNDKTTSVTGATPNKLNYKIPFKFPTSVYNKFRLTETTKVKRLFSDSSVIEYDRQTTYFYHLRAISFPEDGFQKIFVSFDSIQYQLKSGKKVIKFDDQDDEFVPPLNERDFLLFIQPLGKTFEAIYSNYGQVARIEGEDLNEKRNTLKNDIPKYENPERLVAVLDKISDQELTKLFDPLKNILPVKNVNFDTTWVRDIDWNIDVFKTKTSAVVKLNDYRNNQYQLLAEMDSITTTQTTMRLPDMNKECDLKEFKAKGKYTLDLSNVGAPTYGKAEFNYEAKGKITNNDFIQYGETILIWDLLGRTSY